MQQGAYQAQLNNNNSDIKRASFFEDLDINKKNFIKVVQHVPNLHGFCGIILAFMTKRHCSKLNTPSL
jgi:hypothetical protein